MRKRSLLLIVYCSIALLLMYIFNLPVFGKEKIRIAIIDTGFNLKYKSKVNLCRTGHYNFVTNKEEIGEDVIGHGTDLARVISTSKVDKKSYCLIIFKVMSHPYMDGDVIQNISRAIYASTEGGIDIINLAFEGGYPNSLELSALRIANKNKIKIFVPSGNSGKLLNYLTKCDVYPACYKNLSNMYVIGALNKKGTRDKTKNYGDPLVTLYVNGFSNITQQVGTSISVANAIKLYLEAQ